jgi:hypothetical protein
MAETAIKTIKEVTFERRPPTLLESWVSTASRPLLALARTMPQIAIDARFAIEVISKDPSAPTNIEVASELLDYLSLCWLAAFGVVLKYWNKA